MRFYTNVSFNERDNNFYVRGYDNGKRVDKRVPCHPFCFIPTKDTSSPFRTLEGQPVAKKHFKSKRQYKDFLDQYSTIENARVYGFGAREFELVHAFINEEYKDDIQYDVSQMSVVYLDIETDSEGGFPDLETADKEVTAITIKKNGQFLVFGCQPYKSENPNVLYFKCKDEVDLLEKFIKVWQSSQYSPDVVTGWNIEFFDIPYLMRRLENVLGEGMGALLSPWGFFNIRYMTSTYSDGLIQTYHPAGINVMDYLGLYRKFSYTPQESYKLDHIAFMELGEKKLDYVALGYETLDEFYKKDYQNFINYNIKDVDLVERLDNKLKLIEQVYALAYDAKVNMIETQTTVRLWDVMIHNHLMKKGIVVPYYAGRREEETDEGSIQGAYVKDPQVGLHKWVVSFDLNSLYPHIIMQYNISPDTFVDQINNVNIENIISGKMNHIQQHLQEQDVTFCGSGCMFERSRQGFLPALMEGMYQDRVVWKNRMLEAKKQNEVNPSPELVNEIARCHNMQLAKKIQLNSAYGALGNKHYRWYERKYAESITLSGQLAIRWMETKINEYLNKKLKTDSVDYVIACDTDSMYINFERLINEVFEGKNASDEEIVEYLDKLCQKVIEPYIDKCYEQLADKVNAYEQKMKMKREAIANKGIWTGKKHYILNVFNNEGVQYKEPKLKMQGIEAIRSSTPSSCRESIKKALEVIMTKDEAATIDFIDEFRKRFVALPFEEVAFPRGVQNLEKWADHNGMPKQSCPIHVRGALMYNLLVKKHKLSAKYPLITNGDKIKFCYMDLPNPIDQNVFAAPGRLPPEFNMHSYIDYNTQFDKAFLEPIKTILDCIGWKTEQQLTLEDFFS